MDWTPDWLLFFPIISRRVFYTSMWCTCFAYLATLLNTFSKFLAAKIQNDTCYFCGTTMLS